MHSVGFFQEDNPKKCDILWFLRNLACVLLLSCKIYFKFQRPNYLKAKLIFHWREGEMEFPKEDETTPF